jgi:hypothetical protein
VVDQPKKEEKKPKAQAPVPEPKVEIKSKPESTKPTKKSDGKLD